MGAATHYDTLQVVRSASAEVIRAAYKSLSQRHHPDRHPPEERPTRELQMKALNAAYAILSDPEKRSAYDAVLAGSERVQRQPQRPPSSTTVVAAPPVRQPPRAEPAPPPYTPPPAAAAAASAATSTKRQSFRMSQSSKANADLWGTIFGCVLGVILLFKYTSIGSWLASFDWQKVTSSDWPKWLWLGPVAVGLSAILEQRVKTKHHSQSEASQATPQSSPAVGARMDSAPRDLHPWRRFFARFVDVLLYMFVGGFVVGLLEGIVGTHWPLLVEFVVLFITAVLLESVLLSSWGTTPCKWLFGIKVRTATGAKLSSDTAFKRTALVYILGDGLSIPGINLIFNVIGYWRLTTAGTTWWDKAAGTQVTHTPWKPLRAVLCVAAVVGIVFVTSVSNKVVSALSSVGANSSTIEVMPQGVALKPVQVTMTCYPQGDPRRSFVDADCAVLVHNTNEHWVVRAFDVDLGAPGWMNRTNGIADRRYPFSANVLPLETRSYRMVTGLPEPHSFDWTVNNMVGSALP